MWNLKKPCSNCPFRRSALKGWLGRDRAQEIVDGMTGGSHESFFCHKTTASTGTDEKAITADSQHCAGAAIVLHKTQQPNMAMRLGYAFGDFDGKLLGEQQEVFDTTEEFVEHHDDENNFFSRVLKRAAEEN